MGKISGTLSDEAKIYVIDEASKICESGDTHAAGEYEIDHLIQSSKIVVAVFTSDNSSKSFANVTPIDSSVPIEWNINYPGNQMVFSNSNTKLSRVSGSELWSHAYSALSIPNFGKWYIEWDDFNGDTKIFGLTNTLMAAANNDNIIDNPETFGHYTSSGSLSGTTTTTTQLVPFVAGAVYGMMINRDDNVIKFAKNNIWENVGTPIPSPATELWLFAGVYNTGSYMRVNCGQHAFTYAPPSGFTAGLYK